MLGIDVARRALLLISTPPFRTGGTWKHAPKIIRYIGDDTIWKMPGQLCRIGSQGFSNSGGNTLVQLSRMILGAWSPSATGKIFCRFCACCISCGNAPCAKPAKGMRQRQSLCLHETPGMQVVRVGMARVRGDR